MQEKHQIQDLMGVTMEKIRDMVDVQTIIGDPIVVSDTVTIIPVSKVSYGFASGGSDLPAKSTPKDLFGGGAGAGAVLDRVNLDALLLKVLGSTGVIRYALDRGGSLEVQLCTLAVLSSDGIEVVEDGGHERIDLIGRNVVARDDDRADGDGAGIDLGSGIAVVLFGVGAAAAGAQRKHHDEGERQRHDFVELHSRFSPF